MSLGALRGAAQLERSCELASVTVEDRLSRKRHEPTRLIGGLVVCSVVHRAPPGHEVGVAAQRDKALDQSVQGH
jgi:hypothetical protein